MNSIAIIDKHPVVRVGLREFVAQHFENAIIIESDNLLKYNQNCTVDFPEVLIIGNTMELFNSVYHSIAEIKKKCRNSQIIIFDESPDHIKIVRSFKAGAKGYLTKFSDMQELYKCI
jgi:two-component system invasion response regulator UvrY